MVWHVEVDPKSGNVRIQYDLEWLLAVMNVSATSMVPFTLFSVGKAKSRAFPSRSYPRSATPGFILGPKGTIDTASRAGGRHHVDGRRVFELCELFTAGTRELPIPLSDIAILSKRAVCVEVVRNFKGKNFQVSGGAPHRDSRTPEWRIHGYPMLCIIGGPSKVFPKDQGEWRAVQCVFGAVLTQLIRARGIGIEVVSREGFGSVFPTLADLPDGIRLDPGLLPPRAGAEAIVAALTLTDQFITEMRAQKKVDRSIAALNGYTDAALAGVDRLMSVLLDHALKNPKSNAGTYAAVVARHAGHAAECAPLLVNATVDYVLNDALPIARGPKKKLRPEPEDESGYGSESDYEDDDEPSPKKRDKSDGDEEVMGSGGLTVKKLSVLSGMAALRMASFYGMYYSKALFTGKGSLKDSEVAGTQLLSAWAPYFELDHDTIYQGLTSQAGVRMLVMDGAPNPINIPAEPIGNHQQLGAIVIDTTNNTSSEKAEYLAFFRDLLVRPARPRSAGGLLFMVDSASKHPTGGDLVHGVMRVCGTRASVNAFFNNFLKPHLAIMDKTTSAYGLTVLTADETLARREMLTHRLVMRNADLFRTGGASESGGTGLGGSKPDSVELGGSKPGVSEDAPAPPRQGTSLPLVALRNMGRVRRVPIRALPGMAPVEVPKKKGVPSGGAEARTEPSEKPDVESKAKQFKSLGSFEAPPQDPPNLEAAGYYYEEDDIYNLQRYLLRNQANVAVLPGVSRPQWLQMTRAAYTTGYQPAITANTDIIIQPLNRGGNHWALLYITLGAPEPHGGRRARLLYLDPLHPNDVPVDDLQLLQLPFPGIEIEHCLLQYQDDNDGPRLTGQDSCGAWAVHLAVHLATHNHVLPPTDANRRNAALRLRQDHNGDIAAARALDLPVAPVDRRLHVAEPHGGPVLRRRASFGSLRTSSAAEFRDDSGRKKPPSFEH
ncbi:hypothetical protein [Corallococcus aberystwythensis]|uniref:Uncharacterized protein n=1 Tax=Corallococcus aberystwythensis TaxID=2316722 RepID=A0A3A8QY99_9BACT|nr:hypothetical protein [Corallococcus aberystwythensis]RKH68114.1 hypothetical protein D7W81_12895 [Corallococcus aberystwythensis]